MNHNKNHKTKKTVKNENITFKELSNDSLNIPVLEVIQEKLDIDINHFIDNDIILIKSGTATAKTQLISKISKELKEKEQVIFLNIVNLISLAKEQIKTFFDNNTKLLDYQKTIDEFNEKDGVICINSLYKLSTLSNYNYSNKILYIDEVNDLIRSLTHNDGLDDVLNLVYSTLIKLIKNCKKIIFTDATIDTNTLNLLSCRKTNNKTLLIKNNIKKFKNIKANKYLDEVLYLNKMRNYIENDKYFIFGCDGREKITEFYTNLKAEYPEKAGKFLLFTSKQIEKVNIASEQFKDKFVFYSPTITTGVSFVLKDIKQPQFIYITKNPKITPISIYQMSCRTRNMKELNFYSSEITPIKMKNKTIEEVEDKYKNMVNFNNRLFGLSTCRNKDDDEIMVENTFFKLFCYNEYQDQIFKTGFIEHYENILKNDGFEVVEIGQNRQIDEVIKAEFKELTKEEQQKQIENFSNKYFNIETENDISILKTEYKCLYDRAQLLNYPDKTTMNQYNLFLYDDYSLKNYYNFLNLFKTLEYIDKKLFNKTKTNFQVKNITTSYNKIKLLQTFEKHYKINRFELNFDNIDISNEIDDNFKNLYKILFPKRTSKAYNSKENLINIYINLIKNIVGDIPIYEAKQKMQDGKRYYEYNLNTEIIKELFELCKYKNPQLKHYNKELIEKLTGIKPEPDIIIDIYNNDNYDDIYDDIFDE